MSEKKTFNLAKLRGRMVEKFGTVYQAAEAAGIRRELISLALNAKRELTPTEIFKLCEVLEIPDDEIRAYFFTE